MALQDLAWVHIQAATVEHDGHAEVRPVPIAPCTVLDLLDLGIDRLSGSVGGPGWYVIEDPLQMTLHHLGYLDDGIQTTVGGPEVPAIEVLASPGY